MPLYLVFSRSGFSLECRSRCPPDASTEVGQQSVALTRECRRQYSPPRCGPRHGPRALSSDGKYPHRPRTPTTRPRTTASTRATRTRNAMRTPSPRGRRPGRFPRRPHCRHRHAQRHRRAREGGTVCPLFGRLVGRGVRRRSFALFLFRSVSCSQLARRLESPHKDFICFVFCCCFVILHFVFQMPKYLGRPQHSKLVILC